MWARAYNRPGVEQTSRTPTRTLVVHLPLWLCNDAEGAVVVGCLAGAEGSHGDGCLAVAAVERSGIAAGIAVVGGGAARSASGVGEAWYPSWAVC